MKICQELSEDVLDMRVQFCKQMVDTLNINKEHVKNDCFGDVSTFYSNGFGNKRNCRYCCNEKSSFIYKWTYSVS